MKTHKVSAIERDIPYSYTLGIHFDKNKFYCLKHHFIPDFTTSNRIREFVNFDNTIIYYKNRIILKTQPPGTSCLLFMFQVQKDGFSF